MSSSSSSSLMELDKTFEWPEIFTKYSNTKFNTSILLEAIPEIAPNLESLFRQYLEKQSLTKQNNIKQLIIVWHVIAKEFMLDDCIDIKKVKTMIENLKDNECIYNCLSKKFFKLDYFKSCDTISKYCAKNNNCKICDNNNANIFNFFDNIKEFDMSKMEYSNVLIYGDKGCGKTTLSEYLSKQFQKIKKIDKVSTFNNKNNDNSNYKTHLIIHNDVNVQNWGKFYSYLGQVEDDGCKDNITWIIESSYALAYSNYFCKYKFFGKNSDESEYHYFSSMLRTHITSIEQRNLLIKSIPKYTWLVLEYAKNDEDPAPANLYWYKVPQL